MTGEEWKKNVVLPDLKPLPTILPASLQLIRDKVAQQAQQASNGSLESLEDRLQKSKITESKSSSKAKHLDGDADAMFLKQFEAGELNHWEHKCFLRVIYCNLRDNGRRPGVDLIFASLKRHQQSGFHFTRCYFWIQMIDFAIASHISKTNKNFQYSKFGNEELKDSGYAFEAFLKDCPELADQSLYLKFYSPNVFDTIEAGTSMVLPDKKPLPSIISFQKK